MIDILLIEDEIELANIIKLYLDREGLLTKVINDGEKALDFIKLHKIKLIILDITLPNLDGFSICEFTRNQSNIPIIIISGKDSEEDKILGLELGADDYISKPFSIKELIARVKAQLRRAYSLKEKKDKIIDGELAIDLLSREVYFKNKLIPFATKEFELLYLLVKNKRRTIRKEKLFNSIWGIDSFSDYSTLTVHINKIREKLEETPKYPKMIITVWGIGYRYEGFQ